MTEIRDSNFVGVQWDGKAINSIQTIAQALLNLTEVFKSQNINIECLLKVESSETKKLPLKNKNKKGE